MNTNRAVFCEHLGTPVLKLIKQKEKDGDDHGEGDEEDNHQASVHHVHQVVGHGNSLQ